MLKDVKWVVLAEVSLHNMRRLKLSGSYMPNGFADFKVEGGFLYEYKFTIENKNKNIKRHSPGI